MPFRPPVGLDQRSLDQWARNVEVLPDVNSVTTDRIRDQAVTNAKLRDSTAASVIGRSSASSGVPGDIASSTDGQLLIRRGSALAWDDLIDADIPVEEARVSYVDAQDAVVIAAYIAADAAAASTTAANLASAISALNLASGVYTPTLTDVANISASTAFQCQYLRVGSVVHVSGKVSVDPVANTTSTQLGISLPIASNIGANEDCCGTAFATGVGGEGGAILGDTANDRAQLQFVSMDVIAQPMYFTFTYRILP